MSLLIHFHLLLAFDSIMWVVLSHLSELVSWNVERKVRRKKRKRFAVCVKVCAKKLHPKDLSSTSLRMCGKKAKFCAKITWRKIFAVCFVLRHSGSHSVIVGQDLPDVLVPQNLEGAVWGSWGWVTLPLVRLAGRRGRYSIYRKASKDFHNPQYQIGLLLKQHF